MSVDIGTGFKGLFLGGNYARGGMDFQLMGGPEAPVSCAVVWGRRTVGKS